ncbi:hypothetical protein Glove_233g21 [Diversispora epigaea]|uniref:Protein kinase domain-containing protein n=1 Tax=Diversispora epigaea TaxID=1348612 RepID=A0A397IDQ8_9GLOM|nr:hypothetical protein Glove_233g21 [Diversispora epigaea]
MSQEIKKIVYCPAGHSSNDIVLPSYPNLVRNGGCDLCTKEHFIQEFKTWSSGNADIDEIIQEFPKNNIYDKLHWIPYNNFQNIKHVVDGGHGSAYSAELKNGIKCYWNFINQNWVYRLIGYEVALKEIKDSRFDIVKFLKEKKIVNYYEFSANYYGISKNPSTQNYIFVMDLFDGDLHNFLAKKFWDLKWQLKIDILSSVTSFLDYLHEKNLFHRNLHSGNILMNYDYEVYISDLRIDFGLHKLEDDLILNSNNKNNEIYGLIPYIPPEVLRGNEFTREGDIYSFGGIMYEIVTAQRPFADQAHDTYLIIDICNGVRPKVPDFMLNWIPEWYLDLMYQCWSDDPSKRPTANELTILFLDIFDGNTMDYNVIQQLDIADENQKNISESQKQELFKLFLHSNKLHPQSCYINRSIHTLHGLHDLLEEIKSGKSSEIPSSPSSRIAQIPQIPSSPSPPSPISFSSPTSSLSQTLRYPRTLIIIITDMKTEIKDK